MWQLGPVTIRAVLSEAPFCRVPPGDPADGWRLPHHDGGSPRTSAGWSPMDSGGVFIPWERLLSANLALSRDRGSFLPGRAARAGIGKAGLGARTPTATPALRRLNFMASGLHDWGRRSFGSSRGIRQPIGICLVITAVESSGGGVPEDLGELVPPSILTYLTCSILTCKIRRESNENGGRRCAPTLDASSLPQQHPFAIGRLVLTYLTCSILTSRILWESNENGGETLRPNSAASSLAR